MSLARALTRLLVWFVAGTVLASAAVAVLVLRAVLTHDLIVAVHDEALVAAPAWSRQGHLPLHAPPGIRVVAYGPNRRAVNWTGPAPPPPLPRPGLSLTPRTVRWVRPLAGGRGWILAVGARRAAVGRPIRRLEEVLAAVTLVAVLVAGVLARYTAASVGRPLAALALQARRISETGDLQARFRTTAGVAEVRELVASFNWMLRTLRDTFAALRAAEQRERALREAAMHDVLTPLSSVVGMLELLARGQVPAGEVPQALDVARTEAVRLGERIRRLLRPDASGSADLAAVVRQAAHGRPGVRLCGEEPVLARVPPHEALLVCQLLLDNALTHNPPGTPVEVCWTRRNGEVVARVADRGVGMDPETARRAFERGYGHPNGRGRGLGLGLSLVRQLVETRGGRVALDSAPGRGTTVEVRWPAA